ncbi:MAG: S1-like domain-containing RNA-binding protein [Opitutaceae bacterium]|nr:S1-like domain-containing RNA-binding protein [Opitutaceae bacterium]
MAEIGKNNRLVILKEAPHGLYLDGGDHGEILLPKAQIPDWASVGETLSVFVYCDSEDRIIATTKTPLATVGQFASLKVVEVNSKVGAFLNWGLEKDLLLPFREQTQRLREGSRAVVYINQDPHNDRIVATARIRRFVSPYKAYYRVGDAVDLIVFEETPLGYNAIIENAHIGLLYKNELSGPLEHGQQFTGYIKEMRPDGKIDLSRDAAGYRRVLPVAEDIFDTLVDAGGRLPFSDKSPPEQIREKFGISKKAFKQAIGSLYKQRRIEIKDDGIELTKTEKPTDSSKEATDP